MIERITEHPGYLIHFKPENPSDQAVLLLHGFPANRNTKNLDLADAIHRRENCHVFLLHYRGLGESAGVFSFRNSIEEAMGVVDRIHRDFSPKQLSVVGHSWGGLVAMNVTASRSEMVHRLILLSPLCDLDKTHGLYGWIVRDVRNEVPGIYGDKPEAEVRADIDYVIANHDPKKVVKRFRPDLPVTLIQAALDDTTPARAAKELLEFFPTRPEYIELPMDHSFTESRKDLAEAVLNAMQT